MAESNYTAPNDFRAFCEMLNENEMNNTMTHYGIRGQKRGLRRFQNEDGSLTPAGKERYGVGNGPLRSSSKKETVKEAKNNYEKKKQMAEKAIYGTAIAGMAATIGTALVTKNVDKTEYVRGAAIGATAVAALLGGRSAHKAKLKAKFAENPNLDLSRKSIKNANARQLSEKEISNSKKWVKAGLLAGAGAGATILSAKKYGGLTSDTGKKLVAGGTALGLAGLATMERAAINDARIERQRKKLNQSKNSNKKAKK